MKLILSFILLFSFVCNSFASPLIYKTKKTISGYGELAKLETSKYKQIRIAVRYEKSANDLKQEVILRGREGDESFIIDVLQPKYIGEDFQDYSITVESLPSAITLIATGSGVYSVYIYGE